MASIVNSPILISSLCAYGRDRETDDALIILHSSKIFFGIFRKCSRKIISITNLKELICIGYSRTVRDLMNRLGVALRKMKCTVISLVGD